MDDMGLSHNVESQVLYSSFKSMTQSWARCVHNHAYELRNVLSRKRRVQIDVHSASASMLASTSA
jgi:hypothetical protein